MHLSERFVANLGGEVGKYLTGIIELYDDPPPFMLFLHAHENAWHNAVSVNEYACSTVWREENASDGGDNELENRTTKRRLAYGEQKYFLHYPSTRIVRVVPGKGSKIGAVFVRDKKKGKKWFATNNLRRRVAVAAIANHLGTRNYAYFDSGFCSQFSISKKTLLNRPKRFYVRMKDWVMKRGDSIRSIKKTPTVDKVKGLDWSLVFDVEPLRRSSKKVSFSKEISRAKSAGRG